MRATASWMFSGIRLCRPPSGSPQPFQHGVFPGPSSPGPELARLDRQITAFLKRQDELLQQKSQLEASREVSPSVVMPASTLRTPGDAVLTPAPAPPGPWERQRRRRPSRPSPPPQPVFTSCNRFAALSSPPTPKAKIRPHLQTKSPVFRWCMRFVSFKN
ncbi:hypothetical protein SRHO_G00035010 [Serrasalmus rhombeus]